jgi:TPR repeat protein
MFASFRSLCWLVVLLPLLVFPAQAEDRYALVVGNDNYQKLPKLERAAADAREVARVLRGKGFEVVEIYDGSRNRIQRALNDLSQKLRKDGTIGFFFFAGHGAQDSNENLFLPVEAQISDDMQEMRDSSVTYTDIYKKLKNDVRAKNVVMVFDACRETSSRDKSRGLATQAPDVEWMTVAYSASAGQIAKDKLGPSDRSKNGLFTRVFARHLADDNLSFNEVLAKTRSEVANLARENSHEQTPFASPAPPDFYIGLRPAGGSKVAGSAAPRGAAAAVTRADPAQAAELEKAMNAIKSKDLMQGLPVLKRLAEQNMPDAQAALANLYFDGKEVPEDLDEAWRLASKARLQGNINATYLAGLMQVQGKGTPRNPAEGAELIRVAADAGHPRAQNIAGFVYLEVGNKQEAARWLKVSANRGVVPAQLALARLLASGDGVNRNPEEAQQLLTGAAKSGNVEAMEALAAMLYTGNQGIPKNSPEAFNWAKQAMSKNSLVGMRLVGVMLATGDGVAKNVPEAKNILNAAANRGDKPSKDFLSELAGREFGEALIGGIFSGLTGNKNQQRR